MKLNKIKFARLVQYITNLKHQDWLDLEELDKLTEIDVEPVSIPLNLSAVDGLMAAMAGGTQKIEAIKYYRTLTGMGLKESKDAVEKYWTTKYTKTNMLNIEASVTLSATDGDIIQRFILNNFVY